MKHASIAVALVAAFSGLAHATPAMMSAEWTAQACEAWNKDAALTDGLAGKWIQNDKGRGFKIIHLYRTDCGEASKTEMRIQSRDGKATCTYGGAVQNPTLDHSVDYTMHATTQRWNEMGAGEYGPMRAMMLGRLQFQGPRREAMSVMGPFEAFLLLPGKIPGGAACPTR